MSEARRRFLVPYPLVRWVNERLVGRFLVYAFKRELARGDFHEANHIHAAVLMGNTGPGTHDYGCAIDTGITMHKLVTGKGVAHE